MRRIITLILVVIRTIWFLWVLFWFFLTGFVASILYLIIFNFFNESIKYKSSFFVTQLWGKVLLMGMGVIVKSTGRNNIDKNQRYIIVSNHLSMVDIPISMSSSPIPYSFLAKIEVNKIPFVGYLARNMHVLVDRKSADSRIKSLSIMKSHLNDKGSIQIFVEGTRNMSEQPLLKFHNGAFNLAVKSHFPIAVLVILNSEKIMSPLKPFQARPGIVKAIWLEPISTIGYTESEIPILSEIVRVKMLDILNNQKTN
jgi:1-acyl-sn-glycerol-3-phosphate acyltransferase